MRRMCRWQLSPVSGNPSTKSPAQVTYEFLQLGFVEVLLVKDIPGVNVAYLGDFLFQCHPSEKVGGTFLGRECGVFIGLCLQG